MIRLSIIISVKNLRLTRGRTRRNRYHKLGLKSLENRRWYRKLCLLCKVFNSQSPKYLFKTTPIFSRIYITKNANDKTLFKVEYIFFIRCVIMKLTGFNYLQIRKKSRASSHNLFVVLVVASAFVINQKGFSY